METPHLLLLEALTLPEGPARESWNRWRTAADIDKLDYESFLMLPALTGRLEPWLEGDPYGQIITGMCRRAWSQNQVRRHEYDAARAALHKAGIQPVAAIGPLDWSVRYWPERAIRPVGSVDLLTDFSTAPAALQALLKAGYATEAGSPPHYFVRPVRLESPGKVPIRLHWRAMPNSAFSLRRQPQIPIVSGTLAVPPEEALVSAAGGMFDDGMDWRCDAAMIARSPSIDWDRVAFHLRWRPQARRNLETLAGAGYAPIPAPAFRRGWTRLVEPSAALLRLYRRARQG